MIRDDKEFLRVAIITGVHGLLGRLKVLVITDIIERFKVNSNIYIYKDNNFKEHTITEFTQYKNKICLLRLSDINSRDLAQIYRGAEICIEKSEAEQTREAFLDDNSYYYYDILGCSVFLNGDEFGEVVDILEAGAGEILIISDKDGKRHMVPFVESMVDITDITNKKIIIHPVEGMLDI